MGGPRKVQGSEDWLGALQNAVKDGAEPVPDGWKSAAELATEIRRSRPHTMRIVRELLLAGRAESRKFRIWVGNRTYPVPHDKLNEDSKITKSDSN